MVKWQMVELLKSCEHQFSGGLAPLPATPVEVACDDDEEGCQVKVYTAYQK